MVIMTIAATRMHRSLVDFASKSSDDCPLLLHSKTKAKQTHAPQTPPNPIEIAVCTIINQHQTPPMGDNNLSINIEEADKEQNGSGL